MSICPGCGRCRECGQRTAPPYPWNGPHTIPGPVWPTTVPMPNTPWWTGPYYVGDPMPGSLGTITVS